MQPDCTPAPSELDSSKMSGAYAAIEAAEKTINASGDVDEIGQALEDCASEIEGVRDEYQDSYDSLPDSLQQSSSGEEINSKIESLDTFSGLLADAADEARNADGVQEAMDLAISKLDEFEL
jgi:methyl-accepting chemotaxis protein